MDKYYKYKNVFSGAIGEDDMNYIRQRCSVEDLSIVDMIIRTNNEKQKCSKIKKVSHKLMFDIMNDINQMKYVDEVQEYLNNCINNKYELNNVQQKVIDDIIATRSSTYVNANLVKKCPHCGKEWKLPLSTIYTVCGVDPNGKQPIGDGCLKDWCYLCGKRLCKRWDIDKLYELQNREHNDFCCREHASKNKLDYEENYCHCIDRKKEIELYIS
jgi:hypothetical protein